MEMKVTQNRHHRRAKAETGGIPFDGNIEGTPNIAVVDIKKHRAYHTLFTNTQPDHIANELNETWIDPEWTMVAIPKDHFRTIQKLLKQLT